MKAIHRGVIFKRPNANDSNFYDVIGGGPSVRMVTKETAIGIVEARRNVAIKRHIRRSGMPKGVYIR